MLICYKNFYQLSINAINLEREKFTPLYRPKNQIQFEGNIVLVYSYKL